LTQTEEYNKDYERDYEKVETELSLEECYEKVWYGAEDFKE